MTCQIIKVPSWETRKEGDLWTDPYPHLMTSGCCEDVLYTDKDNGTQKWLEQFKQHQVSYSVYASKYDADSWDGHKHTVVTEWMPYPLSDTEALFIAEDSIAFADSSAGWISLASTQFYKGRKYLAPWVEYNPEYDGRTGRDLSSKDLDGRANNIAHQRRQAILHRDIIIQAINEAGLDGYVEYLESDPDGLFFCEFEGGFRVGIDMEQAMAHFCSFEAYKAWWTAICTTYTIQEQEVPG